jgi:endonuclease/exonuclease/phosphatase family metal-dependent hydrolase
MAEKKKKSKGIGRFLFGLTARTFMLMNAGVLVLSYLSMYINPAEAWFMTIFGLLFIVFFTVNLILLLWAIRRRSGAFVIPLLALLPSVFLIGRYVQFSGHDEVSDDSVTLIDYNVGKFFMFPSHSRLKDREECRDSVFAYLRTTGADIICLQEFRGPKGVDVREYLSKVMPGYNAEYFTHITGLGPYGNVILSRFPVVGRGKFDFDESANMALYADLDIGGEVMRVYDCHFESYSLSLPRLVKAFTSREDGKVHEAEEKMRNSITRRPQQVDTVLADIRNSPVESIVTGDFNDTPISYTYQQLKRGKKDTFIEAGKGLGGTYSGLWPFIRIDYVLIPGKCEAQYHKVVRKKYSDHYPIVTRLKIN